MTVESSEAEEGLPCTSPDDSPVWRVALAKKPVATGDRFLYHKTTRRDIYDEHRSSFPEHDEVLLWNERGELTEGTVTNLVVAAGGRLLTPPVASGLLAGTLRAQLLAKGVLREARILRKDLAAADAVYLINSVRGWVRAFPDPTSPR